MTEQTGHALADLGTMIEQMDEATAEDTTRADLPTVRILPSFLLRNYRMDSTSGLTDADLAHAGPVRVNIVYDGITQEQVDNLLDESINRLWARTIARPGADGKASAVKLWAAAKRERRFSFHVAQFASGARRAGMDAIDAAIETNDSIEDIMATVRADVEARLRLKRGNDPARGPAAGA